jgi:hypothetical protein
MVAFTRFNSSVLYVADSNQADDGWWGFVITRALLDGETYPTGPISLKEAVESEVWFGSFVYIAAGPYPDASGRADGFIDKIRKLIEEATIGGNVGATVFLRDVTLDNIDPKSQLSGAGDWIDLNNAAGPVATITGQSAPEVTAPPTNAARLYFAGPARGTFTFTLSVKQSSLYDNTNWGFRLMIPTPGFQATPDGVLPYLAGWLPFAEKGDPQAILNFDAQVNLVNPRNAIAQAARTVFYFVDGVSVTLQSYYRTSYGKKVGLIPVTQESGTQKRSGLAINAGYGVTVLQNGVRLAPVGDFTIVIDGTKPGVPEKLLCGPSGTETIAILPDMPSARQDGSRLRFTINQSANVPVFPLQNASPVGPPIDAKASLLNYDFETSWVSVIAPPSEPSRQAHYAAAPKRAELFGKGNKVAVAGLLGAEDPGAALPGDGSVVFPMLPYAAVKAGTGEQDMTRTQLELVERQITGPTRKGQIVASGAKTSASVRHSLAAAAARPAADNDDLTSTTTPAGFITRYTSDGKWKQLLLAQVQSGDGEVTRQMGFVALRPELQSAFQTSDQFLIIANKENLGHPANGIFMPPSTADIFADPPAFYTTINIGSWDFECQTGAENKYDDYRSVIIVKGVKGKICEFDRAAGKATNASLVLSPDKWTLKNIFAAPNLADLSELAAVSNWLVDYCEDAYAKRDNPYFTNLAKIIQDEAWTGVLILKAAISSIPNEVKGILAGIDDMRDFYAHHIGLQIGQIDKGSVLQTGTTSMFGLIYYVDPHYDHSTTPHPIASSDPNAPYGFMVLTLKALFENSTIKKFASLAQMGLNRIFGSAVRSMVDLKPEGSEPNQYNAILLEGGVQKNGGATVYSLASMWPNRFTLANNILTSVEIDTAQMSTRDDGAKSGEVVSWIAMSGFMNFAIIPANPEVKPPLPAFEIFSFGHDDDQEISPRSGLSFNNLGLRIKVPTTLDGKTPVQRNLDMIETEITFNAQESRHREQSIYKNFQLELLGLLSGNANAKDDTGKSDPAKLGYLRAITQYDLRGVTSVRPGVPRSIGPSRPIQSCCGS